MYCISGHEAYQRMSTHNDYVVYKYKHLTCVVVCVNMFLLFGFIVKITKKQEKLARI